jgi:hypothetical protein
MRVIRQKREPLPFVVVNNEGVAMARFHNAEDAIEYVYSHAPTSDRWEELGV